MTRAGQGDGGLTGASPTTDVVRVESASRSSLALLLKGTVQRFFLLWVAPRLALFRISSSIFGRDEAFLAASESIGRLPGKRGVYSRQAFYRATLEACGRDVSIGWQSVFSLPLTRLGEGVYIGRHCSIGFATVGDDVMLADGVQILSGGREHGLAASADESHRDQPREFRRLAVGKGAWIGTNAILMADVGEGAVVGAGAVVNQPVPARTLAVGVPARVVRRLDA